MVWAFWRPTWKAALISLTLKERRGAFIDVGANLGQTLLDLLEVAPSRRYLGVEPNDACAAFLATKIVRRRLSNCTVVQIGLSSVSEQRDLLRLPGLTFDTSATMLKDLRPLRRARSQPVTCRTLDSLVGSVAALKEGVAAVKIDVEGSELEVIRGMSRTIRDFRPPIICEVLHRHARADPSTYRRRILELESVLDAQGYVVHPVSHTRSSLTIGPALRDGFPLETWRRESRMCCDYLFLPQPVARAVPVH
jgi:FkbM family methyltransferase